MPARCWRPHVIGGGECCGINVVDSNENAGGRRGAQFDVSVDPCPAGADVSYPHARAEHPDVDDAFYEQISGATDRGTQVVCVLPVDEPHAPAVTHVVLGAGITENAARRVVPLGQVQRTDLSPVGASEPDCETATAAPSRPGVEPGVAEYPIQGELRVQGADGGGGDTVVEHGRQRRDSYQLASVVQAGHGH